MQIRYPELTFFVDGVFHGHAGRRTCVVRNPADESVLGLLPWAEPDEVDSAVKAAHRAFPSWRDASPLLRSDILRQAAHLIRERADEIACGITLDNGKPFADARAEVFNSAEHIDWHAEEGRRIYGRIVPPREPNVRQLVLREPVGVCAAISPWNFPFGQAIKKVAAALAAGCTMVLKGPAESPSAIVAMAHALQDAGLPPGVFNIVWGNPADISRRFIESPLVRSISFTGSVPIGRELASQAAFHMKRMSMELGGHAPVLVFDDADLDRAAALLARLKTRNAGQVCVSPTRFFVQRGVHDRFADAFRTALSAVKIGQGFEEGVQMGPLIHERRFQSIVDLVDDARREGADIVTGGGRIGERGWFHEPTLLANVPDTARIMQEEPFGPLAALSSFSTIDEALERANALPFGLAAYVFTNSFQVSTRVANGLQAGMVNINHSGMANPELPFGGVKDSGFGSEGGTESFDSFLVTKMISQV
ncbi:NAD-dependent succinate-semialdehyde dehydrogenase [Bordetella sp. FB-8]|uniref:NAD-dependent succinate-semialdehyde dehydrogenase n=1 Tax=Bordetella sp. FB-8 TaxID=1159870 RepID=UPI0003779E28|nr:NAD-dependent succinate-semialdehyde dehydrogenase [Bordetella sp. FB-8]